MPLKFDNGPAAATSAIKRQWRKFLASTAGNRFGPTKKIKGLTINMTIGTIIVPDQIEICLIGFSVKRPAYLAVYRQTKLQPCTNFVHSDSEESRESPNCNFLYDGHFHVRKV